MMKSHPYITEPKQEDQKYKILKNYTDKLEGKISGAHWKQNLVLKYNYMPLTTIQDSITHKIKSLQQNYITKQAQLQKLFNNKEIEQEMAIFKEFEARLKGKIEEIQLMIQSRQMEAMVMKAQIQDKKMVLKETIKDNMHLGKAIFHERQQEQIFKQIGNTTRLKKSQSTRTQVPHQMRKTSKLSTRYTTINSRVSEYKDHYEDCLDSIIKSLRKMHSSQDVQDGIYLDIMVRKKQSLNGRYSSKSKICNTLIERYGKQRPKQKLKEVQDFYMSWETFKELNWKQIMGIVLVRDKNGEKLKHLLKCT